MLKTSRLLTASRLVGGDFDVAIKALQSLDFLEVAPPGPTDYMFLIKEQLFPKFYVKAYRSLKGHSLVAYETPGTQVGRDQALKIDKCLRSAGFSWPR